MSGFVKWFVEGKVAGFDFSGVVQEAPATSKLKPGDAVFGCAPPFVGTFCEYVNVPQDQVRFGI
jgi:NADPH:quinone reductase-like Zn-dependent oxidoreductase